MLRTRSVVAVVALSLLAVAPARAQTGAAAAPSPERLRQSVDSIARRAARIPIEGISIAVSRGDRVLLHKGYGLADVEAARPVDEGTVFEIGSVTKQFTAAAVLRLAEEGRLGLDDEVLRHLPALGERGRGVTLRQLLGHTSGLSSTPAVRDLFSPADPAAVVDTLAARAAESAPGERFRYNNNGYVLLGLVVEHVSGRPYPEYLEAAFFKPLGMSATAVCGTVAPERMAKGYTHPTRSAPVPEAAPRHHPSVGFSAGNLCSTAGDLLRWQQALATGRALRPESYRQMSTPTVLASGRAGPYGLGMYVQQADGRPYLNHGGNTSGFVATVAHYPADSLSVVVLTNGIYAPSIVDQVERAVARAALGLSVPAIADLPLNPAERGRFVGTYSLGGAGSLEVYEQGDHLRAQPPGRQVAARMLYQGDDTFVAEHDPSLRLRFTMDGERAGELVLQQGDREVARAARVP